MTNEELTTENEALHGLLAAACEVLYFYATGYGDEDPKVAADCLAQIREGYVA